MKLLTPTQTVTDKEQRFQENLKKSASLDKELARKRLELQKLERDYEIIINKQRIILEKEKEEYYLQINVLKSEVENLVLKRKDELVPLTEKWKELEEADRIIKEREQEVIKKGEIFDENLETLEEKLTEVADREKVSLEMAQKQALAQEGIEREREQIKLQQASLNALVAEATGRLSKSEQEISKKEAEIELKVKVLTAKEFELNKKESSLKDKEREINDKYNTLQRTINRYAG